MVHFSRKEAGMLNPRVLGVFAKWPAAGAVKTRLGEAGGPDWGARVARAFLLDTLTRLGGVAGRRVVAFAPPEAREDFAGLVPSGYELTPQCHGDLGNRMAAFIAEHQRQGAGAVVLVGADSPTLPVEWVERAFVELQQADLVLGPALDGGFYLFGCGRRLPPVFEGVDWSTNRVLAQTVARLSDPGWRLALLPPWYDVDTPADWNLLCGHLAALRRAGIDPQAPATEALVAELSGCKPI
jgi:rSAM/selenodomain-associated transferase 1